MIEADTVIAQGTLKATCSRDELLQALGLVSRGVSTRSSVQILAGILLEASEGKLRLAATDMEVSLRTAIDAKIEADGSVVVPGRLLLELARLLPEAEVSIEHKLEEARVRDHAAAPRATACTPTTPRTSRGCRRPTGSSCTRSTATRCSRRSRGSAARPRATSRARCSPACSSSFEPGKLVMAATDSYRLSVKETALEGLGPRARGDRAGPGARRARADRSRGREARARRSREPGRLRDRRRVAHDAPHRRPVPERTSSSSRTRSSTRSRSAARSCSTSCGACR